METPRTQLAKALRVAAVTCGVALFLAALGWAGESDIFLAALGWADEAELVKLYEHGKSKCE